MADIRTQSLTRMFETILKLETVEQCYAFFEDLCTVRELQDLSQRLDVAYLLGEGKNYQEVARHVSVSSATISRVKKCLEYGSGGYQWAVAEKKKEEQK